MRPEGARAGLHAQEVARTVQLDVARGTGRRGLRVLRRRGDIVRVVDHDVRFGVTTDKGDGDEWPAIRERMLDADIVVVATPIWMGQPSSVCKMVLERLDAELGETDDDGHYPTHGKVAARRGRRQRGRRPPSHRGVLQALNDIGFTIPANGGTYWNGEAMRAPTTTTSTRPPRRRRRRRRRWRRTPSTSPGCSSPRRTRPAPDRPTVRGLPEAVGVRGGVAALQPDLVHPRPRNSSPCGKNRSSSVIPPPGATSILTIQAPTPSG